MDILRSSASIYTTRSQSLKEDSDSLSLSITTSNRSEIKSSQSIIPVVSRSSPVHRKSKKDIKFNDSDKTEYFKEYKSTYDVSKRPENNDGTLNASSYEIHNSQSFVQSTLNKKWFLPSITSSDNYDNEVKTVNNLNNDILELNTAGSSNDYQNGDSIRMHLASLFNSDVIDVKTNNTEKSSISSYSSSISSRVNLGMSLKSLHSQVSTLTESEIPKQQQQQQRLLMHSNSFKKTIIPSVSKTVMKQQRVLTENVTIIPGQIRFKHTNNNDLSNQISSDHNNHNEFLSELFESEISSSIKFPDRFPTSTSHKIYPPLEQIKKLTHDLHESPIAHTKRKLQSRNKKLDENKNKNDIIDIKVRDLLSIPVIMNNSTTLIQPITTSMTTTTTTTSRLLTGSSLKATVKDDNNSANFFFPAVLMVSNPEEELSSDH